MHIEDSPVERTPDLVAKIRALRQQAERDMDRFTDPADYEVRHVTGKKPKTETAEVSVPSVPKRKRGKEKDQPTLAFTPPVAEPDTSDGEEL